MIYDAWTLMEITTPWSSSLKAPRNFKGRKNLPTIAQFFQKYGELSFLPLVTVYPERLCVLKSGRKTYL